MVISTYPYIRYKIVYTENKILINILIWKKNTYISM